MPSTTRRTPASRMRESRWARNGTPAVGSIGFGADRVSGRSRVPLPADQHHGFDVVQHSGVSLVSVVVKSVRQGLTDRRSSLRTGRGARSAR